MKKLNLYSFTYPELVSKLFCIQKDFNTEYPEIPEKTVFLTYVQKVANIHFEIPNMDTLPGAVYSDLALFLLGNEDNKFSKCINEN